MKRAICIVLFIVITLTLIGCSYSSDKGEDKMNEVTKEIINPYDYGVPKLPVDRRVVLHYDMSHYSYMLFDMSGYGNHGIMHSISDSDFSVNGEDDILVLPGTNGSYIEIPLSVAEDVKYNKGFSIEMTFMPKTNQHQFLWTLGTGYQTDYLRINPASLYGGYFEATIKTQSNNNSENTIGRGVILEPDEMSVTTVTYDGEYFKVYANGKYIGELENKHDLSAIFKGNGNDILGYIAKSNWDDPYCDAIITDFKIYNKVLDEDEILKTYEEFSAKQQLRLDMMLIDIPSYTYEDLALVETGANGSKIR